MGNSFSSNSQIKDDFKDDFKELLVKFPELQESNITNSHSDSIIIKKEISLTKKKITDISFFGSFHKNFQSVFYLNLERNKIRSIDALKGIKNIRWLNVAENKIECIQINTKEGIEKVFQQLKVFYCWSQSDNSGDNLELSVLKVQKMPNLEQLNASSNKNVSEVYFKDLPRLKFLALYNFKARTLKADETQQNDRFGPSFAEINSYFISSLNFSSSNLNSITFLTQAKSLSSLKYLNLQSNKLTKLPQLSMQSLRTIILKNNRLKFMKEVRKLKCPNLVQLQFGWNRITNFELCCDGFECSELTQLVMMGNIPTMLTKWAEEVFIWKRTQNPIILGKLQKLSLQCNYQFEGLVEKWRKKQQQIIEKLSPQTQCKVVFGYY